MNLACFKIWAEETKENKTSTIFLVEAILKRIFDYVVYGKHYVSQPYKFNIPELHISTDMDIVITERELNRNPKWKTYSMEGTHSDDYPFGSPESVELPFRVIFDICPEEYKTTINDILTRLEYLGYVVSHFPIDTNRTEFTIVIDIK